VTASSWRTWPQRKLRRNVPRVDAALTAKPRTLAVLPAPRAPASIGTALRGTAGQPEWADRGPYPVSRGKAQSGGNR
jgi:hypothetical protein